MGQRDQKEIKISIESSTIIKTIAFAFLAIVLVAFIRIIAPALVILFISFFLALALNPAVSWIAHRLKSGSRVAATGIAYLIVMSLLVGFLALVVPPLVRQTANFVSDFPQTVQNIKSEDSALSKFINRYNLSDEVDKLSLDFHDRFKDIGKPALSAAGAVGVAFVTAITVFVMTFMMLVEGPVWIEKILAIQPKNKRKQRQEMAQRMYRVVTKYVNGQVIVAFIAATFALVTLIIASNIFNVSVNPIALAGIVMIFDLLPMIGATLGSIVVVIACLLVSLPLAITMAVYFIIYQQIENITIQPYVQSRSNNLTPLIVFAAALIGVNVGGILGAFVAIPLAGCIKILLEEHYSKRVERANKEA